MLKSKGSQRVRQDSVTELNCSFEKSYDQSRQHIKKQRHYFANKGPSSKAMVFPVVMYVCESWTVKKAECRRIDAFEVWCWRRLLRVPWTARRSNQSILKAENRCLCSGNLLGSLWRDGMGYCGELGCA